MIDALHKTQGHTLAQESMSIAFKKTTQVDQKGGVVVVGIYSPSYFNWITLENAPLGTPGLRGSIRVDRNLNQQNAAGLQSYDFPNPNVARTMFTLWFAAPHETDDQTLQINFGESFSHVIREKC